MAPSKVNIPDEIAEERYHQVPVSLIFRRVSHYQERRGQTSVLTRFAVYRSAESEVLFYVEDLRADHTHCPFVVSWFGFNW